MKTHEDELFAYEALMNSAEDLLAELRMLPRIDPALKTEILKIQMTAIKAFVFAQHKVVELKGATE